MAGFGKELVWNWKGVRIVSEEKRNGVGREMELQWKEVGSACAISTHNSWAGVVVGVREKMLTSPLRNIYGYPENSWTGCCCGREGKC
eukprot:scaffold27866_cov78-Cyclotella_meneghiniana.AAC.3